jgi:MtN3 and saliva related transmembrane protein
MQHAQWVGWFASLILLFTIGKQIYKQWREQTVKGISKWLFAGQTTAELGFVIYSYLVRDWVFVATNLALLIENFVGLCLFYKYRMPKESVKTPPRHLRVL